MLHHKNSICGAIGATRNVATRLVPSRQIPLASSTCVDTANRVGSRFAFCKAAPGRADVCTRISVERGSKSNSRRPRLVLSVRGETFLGFELAASLEAHPFSVRGEERGCHANSMGNVVW